MRFGNSSWLDFIFSDLFEISNGINKDKSCFGKGTSIINYMDVNKHAFLYKSMIKGLVESNEKEQQVYSVYTTDILVTRTSETKDEIAYTSCVLEKIEKCVFPAFY